MCLYRESQQNEPLHYTDLCALREGIIQKCSAIAQVPGDSSAGRRRDGRGDEDSVQEKPHCPAAGSSVLSVLLSAPLGTASATKLQLISAPPGSYPGLGSPYPKTDSGNWIKTWSFGPMWNIMYPPFSLQTSFRSAEAVVRLAFLFIFSLCPILLPSLLPKGTGSQGDSLIASCTLNSYQVACPLSPILIDM